MIVCLLKINIALLLFYIFYRLLLQRDTFFTWRRTMLLGCYPAALLTALIHPEGWSIGGSSITALTELYAALTLPEVSATAQAAEGRGVLATDVPAMLYGGIALLLTLRLLFRLACIIRLARHTPTTRIEGIRVHLLDEASGPFSFFGWIFVHRASHSDEELREILAHECAHVRQGHSADVMMAEVACILCWFNPFVWLMKREIRTNLEYLADERVLQMGYDPRSYQYHLLALTQSKPKAIATLYNNFNVLPLKKRIFMMNKKRTQGIGRAKYLLLFPLMALLMAVGNVEAVAQEKGQKPRPTAVPEDTTTVFNVVEQMPEFPDGGMPAMMAFISKNMKYPAEAAKNKVGGRVIVQFVVDKDGSITESTVIRSVSPELDAEALRVVNLMPKWKPGMIKGEPVRVKFTIPLAFSAPK